MTCPCYWTSEYGHLQNTSFLSMRTSKLSAVREYCWELVQSSNCYINVIKRLKMRPFQGKSYFWKHEETHVTKSVRVMGAPALSWGLEHVRRASRCLVPEKPVLCLCPEFTCGFFNNLIDRPRFRLTFLSIVKCSVPACKYILPRNLPSHSFIVRLVFT
jgi:hypothetical protein